MGDQGTGDPRGSGLGGSPKGGGLEGDVPASPLGALESGRDGRSCLETTELWRDFVVLITRLGICVLLRTP